MPLASARGATTCPGNEPQAITGSARELLLALLEANPGLTPRSALALFFTVTPDLDAAFPAAAARALGFTATALLGATEAAVPGAPERCLRVLALFEVDGDGRPAAARHGVPVYLRGAERLRPDLPRPTPAPTSPRAEGGGPA